MPFPVPAALHARSAAPNSPRRHRLERPEQLLDVPRLSPDDDWWADWLAEVGVDDVRDELPPTRPRPRQPGDGGQCRLRRRRHRDDDADVLARASSPPGRLVQPFAAHPSSRGRSHWLVYPEGRRNQAKIAAFRDWLLGRGARGGQDASLPRSSWSRRSADLRLLDRRARFPRPAPPSGSGGVSAGRATSRAARAAPRAAG